MPGRTGTAISPVNNRRDPIPVADRAEVSFTDGALSDGTILGGTGRILHTMQVTASGLMLEFSNFYNNNGVETDNANDITISAAIEPASGKIMPISFGGARSVTIKPGQTVRSDRTGVALDKGATFFTRTYITIASGTFPRGGALGVTGNGEGHNYANPAGADLTAVGASTPSTSASRIFGPSAILGIPKTNTAPVFAIIGDSIASGYTDTDRGPFLRALNANYPFQRLAFGSELVDGWMAQSGLQRFRQARLLSEANVTAIICQLGVNSLGNASTQANMLTMWQYLARYGVPVYQTTITPVTTSSDGWVTVGNQTVGANETRRTTINDYIRTTPSPLAGYFDVADLAESARNSGKWKANYTADGLHPNPTAAAALAAAITPSIFGPVAT